MTEYTTTSAHAQKILAFICDREVTRTEINRECFSCHLPAADLDAALAELERCGVLECETRQREVGAGTPTTIYRVVQARQGPIDVAPMPTPAIAEGRKVLAVLTRLKSERVALKHELQQRRDRLADTLLAAEMGDADAIAERGGFPAHELRIETRLREIEPSIATLDARFRADQDARRIERELQAYRTLDPLLPKRVDIAMKTDELIVMLGAHVRALIASHGRAVSTLRPHLSSDALWNLTPDAHVLARTVIGRVMSSCGFDTQSVHELSGTGVLELLRQEPVALAVRHQHNAILARRPYDPAPVIATEGEAA